MLSMANITDRGKDGASLVTAPEGPLLAPALVRLPQERLPP